MDQVLTRKIVQLTLDKVLHTLTKAGRIESATSACSRSTAPPRKARNPKTNQEVVVPARKVISFQPGKNVAAGII